MKQFNIAVFTDSFIPQVNGVVTSIKLMIKELVKNGCQVTIVAPYYKGIDEFVHPGIEVIRVKGIKAKFYDGFKWVMPFNPWLVKRLKNKNIDLVHFMTPFGVGYMGILAARKLKVPLVGTYHTFILDAKYMSQWILTGGPISQKITRHYTKIFYDAANLITVPTRISEIELKKYGLIADSISISNGLDFSIFSADNKDEIKKRYQLGDKVILYLGRISLEKNIDRFLPLMDILYKKDSSIQLLLIGDGPYRWKFEEELRNRPYNQNVKFTGLLSHNEITKQGYFDICQIYVSFSDTESQSISLLESQANGLVPVVAGARGHKDLVNNGEDGFLFEPNNIEQAAESVLKLFSDPELYQQLQRQSLLEVKKHDKEKIGKQWLAVYDDLINSGQWPYHTTIRRLKNWRYRRKMSKKNIAN